MDRVAKMILSHFDTDHDQDCECDRWIDCRTDKKGKPYNAPRKVNCRKRVDNNAEEGEGEAEREIVDDRLNS